MTLRYQTQMPNSESDQGIDNYDYSALLRLLRARAGFVFTNVEIDRLWEQIGQLEVGVSNIAHDATISGVGTEVSPLSVANDGHTHDTQYNTKTEIGTLFTNYIIVSDTEPTTPATGQLWLDTSA